jgi:predicted ATPase
MKLKSVSYAEWPGQVQEWRINDLLLGPRNLLVGKNASGKSRSLAIIGALAKNLAGTQQAALSGEYSVNFEHNGDEYLYEMAYRDSAVVRENVKIAGRTFLSRGAEGIGKIVAEKVSATEPIDFQTPTHSFAAFARRDSLQHSFLEPLASWADSLRLYHFAGNLGKYNMAAFMPGAPRADDREESAVVGLFRDGKREFGDAFVESIKRDLLAVDYPVDDIFVAPPISISFLTNPSAPSLQCLQVKETGLSAVTDQFSMSDGMYRVFALLIHVNLAEFRKSATTILVDDIGEGLDFDRSLRLIELLREKATASNLQLVMSTNDRFVMNSVPLEEWTVLHRKGQTVQVRNYANSKDHFDQFKFTGLSNFSFFEMNAEDLSSVELATDDDDDDDDEGYDFPNREKRDV